MAKNYFKKVIIINIIKILVRKLKEKIYYDNERVRQGLKVGYKARYRTRYFGDDDLFYDEFEFKNSYKHF